MASKAKITDVSRSDQTLNVEVEFSDTVSGFLNKRVFNFHSSATFPDVQTEIKRVGQEYRDSLVLEANLKGKVGTEVII